MKAFFKVLCCMLLVCGCSLGLLAGCGNPLDNVRIYLEGESLVETDEGYNLTLTLDDKNPDLNEATITAVVEGLSGDLLGTVEWDYDQSTLSVVSNNQDNTEVVVSGLNPSTNTRLTAFSIESREICAVVNVEVIVKPRSATLSTDMNNFGIPVGQEYVLDPGRLFSFEPLNATVPDYIFNVGGQIFNSNEPFMLDNRGDGTIDIVAYPANQDDYTLDEFNALTVTMNDVRVYTALTSENTYLASGSVVNKVSSLELIQNSNLNISNLIVVTPDNESVVVTLNDVNSLNGNYVDVNIVNNQITIMGIEALDSYTNLEFLVTVAGVSDAQALTLSLPVRVVEVPTGVIINRDTLNTDFSVNVYDVYREGVGINVGTAVTVELSPASAVYNNIRLDLVLAESDVALIPNLLVNGSTFNSGMMLTSGQTLYFRSTGGSGVIVLNVVASDTENLTQTVSRRLILNIQQGVTNIEVSDNYIDSETNSIVLQYDEYGRTTSFTQKTLSFNVAPDTASAGTVSIYSMNENIVTVTRNQNNLFEFTLTANSPGSTTINFVAESGATQSVPVTVLTVFEGFTISLDDNIPARVLGTVAYQDVIVAGIETTTLESAFLAQSASIQIHNTFYPSSATSVILGMNITTDVSGVAYAQRQTYQDILLSTLSRGDAQFSVQIEYYRLSSNGVQVERATHEVLFDVHIFVPISNITVNQSNVELLASTTGSQSYYDTQRNTAVLEVTVYPLESEVGASSATWAKNPASSTRLELSNTEGATTTITANPLSSTDNYVNIDVVVTVTDINGIPYSQVVHVTITKITRITDILIDGYADSNNEGLYFELYKQEIFDLNLTIQPSNATNRNVEYILFDADYLGTNYTGSLGTNIIRLDTGRESNNQIVYDYYRVYARDTSTSQYECDTAVLTYDATNNRYSVVPARAGYAFLFIIPQDILDDDITTIENLTSQMQNPSDSSSMRRILITVADGYSVPFRLYTAEDVASIGNTAIGLSSKYYLMNTIDMSSYLIRNPDWTPIGTRIAPFSGSIISMGCEDGTGTAQSIVGWTLRKDLTQSSPQNDSSHSMFYGIFGVVTGEIRYVNFYINSYTVYQTTCREDMNTPIINGEYNYGFLVGELNSTTIGDSTRGAVIDHVTVSCSNVIYQNPNTLPTLHDYLTFNLGAIGKVSANCIVDNMNVNISARITSNDLKVSFGAIAGSNEGSIGTSATQYYTNTAYASVTVTDSSSQVSGVLRSGVVGVAVGQNMEGANIYGVNADGNIDTGTNENTSLGGVVGINAGYLQNSMSSGILRARGNVGGIVGSNSGTLSNIAYEVYSLSSNNCGISGGGSLGGIVGLMTGGSIEYAIAQGYYIDAENPNITSDIDNTNIGGLVGAINTSSNASIQSSFANIGLVGSLSSAGNMSIGGLVGSTTGVTSIFNAYARGIVSGTNANLGAVVGTSGNQTSTFSVYTEFSQENDLSIVGTGSISTNQSRTIILVNDASLFTSTTNLIYLDKNSANATSLNYYIQNGFNANNWDISANINDGYPYLLKDGEPFVRIVPNSISITAKTFESVRSDVINGIQNVYNDDVLDGEKLILFYDDTAQDIMLSNLFDFASDPELDAGDVRMQITLSNTNVLQLNAGLTFDTTSFRIVGTGTVIIRFVSSQNNVARDAVQIAVIDGFESFNLYAGTDTTSGNLIENGTGANNTIRIKNGGNTQAFVEYIDNNEAVSASAVDGGLRFSVQDPDIISLGFDEWTQGDLDYYYYLDAEYSSITFVANSYSPSIEVTVTPFLRATFYTLDENLSAVSSAEYRIDIFDPHTSLVYDTVIYKGATGIAIGIADSTQVYAGDSLVSSVTVFTDNYKDGDSVLDHIGYSVRLEGADSDLINTEDGIETNDMYIQFGAVEYSLTNQTLIIPFSVSLSNMARNDLNTAQSYTITFWALDENGDPIGVTDTNGDFNYTMTAPLYFTFIPQKINHIDMAHYSDAVNSGSRLQQAGQLPTNTLIAGQYGLLNIRISPDFANYDRVEVVNASTNPEEIMFDQRILRYENDIATYYSWQTGVENIDGGVTLYRVSNIDGSFDGNYYVRTLISAVATVGSQFTVTVRIYQGENTYTQDLTMTVVAQDTLSLSYDNYNSNINTAYVAAGTGYTIGSNTLEQNRNEINVVVGSSFIDYSISASIFDSDGTDLTDTYNVLITSENGRYYLYTGTAPVGSTITVTLTGRQNMSGLINTITRTLDFLVVDFYISSISDGLVNGNSQNTTLRYPYIRDAKYDLRIFEGATLENLDTITAITFNPNDSTVRQQVMDLINRLNGIGEQRYFGWWGFVPDQDGNYYWTILEPMTDEYTTWLDSNYKFYNDYGDSGYLGYQVEGAGVSSSSRIRYDLYFDYENGHFTLIYGENVENSSRGYSTGELTLEFYQMTSQEHAQPIYTERDLMNMESGIDYILLNDIYITSNWTALTTEIASLNGNGYTIYLPNSINSNSSNYGLFDTVTENMVIKNVTIALNSNGLTLPSSISSSTSLNFGAIAGVNEGTIYNCVVNGWMNNSPRGITIPQPSDTSANFYIGGLVGTNNASGAISNSRVLYTNITGFGRVSGLVSANSGTIASSYYTGGTITNTASSTGTNVATAGLVVENNNGATIFGSFVGGAYTEYNDETGENTSVDSLSGTRDALILSGVRTAGFVYNNYGSISDSYSAAQIWAIEASGFAFSNSNSATITRCYSVSILTDASDSGVTSLSMPFIGVDSTQATENNNLNPNGIVNCYFLNTGFSSNALRLEDATELTLDQMLGNSGSTVFEGFTFSREGSEFTGVWTLVDVDNDYFTPDRFTTYLNERNQMNLGPKLVSASLIATPRLNLDEANTSVDPDTGVIQYVYTQQFVPYFTKTTNTAFGTDYSYDPVTITNATQFNNAFSTTDIVIVDDIRLARDIDQSEISATTSLNSPTIEYAGIFEGNSFTFENLNLAVNDESVSRYGLFGLIRSETTTDGILHTGTVKNLNISVTAVSCSQVDYVGALAGIVDGGNIYNINISGQNSRVIGYNAVGGAVGLITGTSRASNITANIGVTANYRANTEALYNYDLRRASGSDNAYNNIGVLGMAGGVFGIADLTQFDSVNTTTNINEAMLQYIYSTGQTSIVGKIAGGIVGALGVHTVLNYAEKTVDTMSSIRGYQFAGGLVGQNNGVIRYSNVVYTDDVQNAVDSANTGEDTTVDLDGDNITVNNTLFDNGQSTIGTGGLVGINIGYTSNGWSSGAIYYSSSKVRVRNSNGANVGGIVGVAYGGDIRAVFATGGLLGSRTANLGGIVGYIDDFSNGGNLTSIDNPFDTNVSAQTTLDYCVALNNYLASDYNYYYELSQTDTQARIGAQGGLVGYCVDPSLIYTTHTTSTGDPDEPYGNLINSINFYVNQIYNRVVLNTVVDEQTGENVINLRAVGNDEADINCATGYTRGYMLNNFDEIFDGWDSFSISNENGMPSIDIQDVPDTININTVDDYNIMYWHPDKNYILMQDIDFLAEQVAVVPVGSESAPFTGSFNGNGHTLKNVPIVQTGAMNAGIFGATDGATIRNVKIVNLYISTNLSDNLTAYVGGLIGVARNTTVSSVNITNDSTVVGAYHGISTTANNVGGLFGRFYSDGDNTASATDCYVIIDIDAQDNSYTARETSANVGGAIGQATGENTTFTNIMAEGSISATYDVTGLNITHYVGGFVGSATSVNITSAVSHMDITLNNIQSSTYAGGFVGLSNENMLDQIDSASNLTLNLVNIGSNRLFVGGVVGNISGGQVTTFISSGDITLNGEYDTSLSTTSHALGGIAGSNAGGAFQVGYSIASIFNNTRFENIDLSVFSGGLGYASVVCDTNLGLTARDTNNVGATSASVINYSASTLTRPQGSTYAYARLNTNSWSNFTDANTRYTTLYNYDTVNGDTKRTPIIISNYSNFATLLDTTGRNYLYYLQVANITGVSLELNRTLYGWYNAGGNSLTAISLDTLEYDNFTATTNKNYGIFDTLAEVNGRGSIFSGAVIRLNVSTKIGDGVNFGGLAGEIDENAKVFAVYVSGSLTLGLESGTANVGAIAGINKGQIIGSGSGLDINWYGGVDLDGNILDTGGSVNLGALVGWSSNTDTRLTFIDSFATGTITNYSRAQNTYISGFVGRVTNESGASLGFYNENCYTAVSLIDNGSAILDSVVANRNGGATNVDGVYYDNTMTTTQNTYFTPFSVASERESGVLSLGTAFISNDSVNYGLPYLRWLESNTVLKDTGSGSISSPYLINSAGLLNWALSNGRTSYYMLENDIDFNLLTRNFTKSNFAGHLNGRGYSIGNISETLIGTLSGEVSNLALNDATASVILADNVSGSASIIYTNSASGAVVSEGNISNSLSNGATFGSTATNCFTALPNNMVNLDGDIWVHTGRMVDGARVFELREFVDTVGENAKFGVSVSMISDEYIINTVDELSRLVEYANTNGGTYSVTINSGTLDLNNMALETLNNFTLNFTTVSNGLIVRNTSTGDFTSSSTNNHITTISNAGVWVLNGSVFGPTGQKFDDLSTLSITNSFVYVDTDTSLFVQNFDSARTINTVLDSVEIFTAPSVVVYGIASNIYADATVNVTIANVTASNLTALVDINNGTLNIVTDESLTLANYAITNNGTIIVNGVNIDEEGEGEVEGGETEGGDTETP